MIIVTWFSQRDQAQVASEFDARYAAFDPNLRRTILPIFWAEEVGEVGDADARTLTHTLYPVRCTLGATHMPGSCWREASLTRKVCVSVICCSDS